MNKKAIALAVTLVIMAVLLTLGAAIFSRSINEKNLARRSLLSTQAFWLAEAGLQRAIHDLKQDFENDSTPSWSDGELTSVSLETAIDLTQGGSAPITNYDDFYSLPYGTRWDYNDPQVSTVLAGGSFSVELANVSGKEDEIWVRSTGAVEGIERTVEAKISVENISPWNNTIFGGTGATDGTLIKGNVDIRGSVHILGEELSSDDLAIDMSGSAKIGNNYEGIPSDLAERIPSLPTVEYGAETVETLAAVLRIKQGKAGLSGAATVGELDQAGNDYKETLDGVYVTGDWVGNKGEDNVYSDNGTGERYDLGDAVSFPSLSTYKEGLKDSALVISGTDELNELKSITPNSNFSFSDGKGNQISMDGNGNLTISGLVYIEGDSLAMNRHGSNKTITYSGSGSIVVDGQGNNARVEINTNLLSPDEDNSFPANNLGIMCTGEISFNEANINVMGTFYAENEISVQKQTNIAGTIVSNYFNLGSQVPSIYQVPELINNLPPKMIGSDPIGYITIDSWKDLDNPYPLQ